MSDLFDQLSQVCDTVIVLEDERDIIVRRSEEYLKEYWPKIKEKIDSAPDMELEIKIITTSLLHLLTKILKNSLEKKSWAGVFEILQNHFINELLTNNSDEVDET